jgi:hypothetical protein
LALDAAYQTFYINGSEKARIDTSGRFLVGTSTAYAAVSGVTPSFQLQGTGENAYASIARWAANTANGGLIFNKSRGASVGTRGVVAASDGLGEITFAGDDGTNFIAGARIEGIVDGTPGTNDMPGRLVFSTTADGASSPTERLRISQNGEVLVQSGLGIRSVGGFYVTYAGLQSGFVAYDAQSGTPTQGLTVVVCRGNDGAGSVGAGVSLSRSATSWGAYSDERAKTDLVPIDDGLAKVSTLRSVTGRYLDDEPGTSRSFLIAQDVQAVLPEAVDAGDPDKLNLRYAEVIPLLVAALKESKERIETLEARLTALEGA